MLRPKSSAANGEFDAIDQDEAKIRRHCRHSCFGEDSV